MPERETSEEGITTSLAVGEGTVGEYHLTLMPERGTSEKGITTSHAVGEGTTKDYHLTLIVGEENILKKELPPHAHRRRGDHKRISPHARAGEENILKKELPPHTPLERGP